VPKILCSLPNNHESVVDNFFDILEASCETRQEASQTTVITEVQLFECKAVTRLNRDEQTQVIEIG